jgi:hypothetical protein
VAHDAKRFDFVASGNYPLTGFEVYLVFGVWCLGLGV